MSVALLTGVAPSWLGNPPKEWRVEWMKWKVRLSTSRPSESEAETLPYVSNEDIEPWTGRLIKEELAPLEGDGRRFWTGDVLFNKLRPYLAKVHHAAFDGVSSGELLCLRPSAALHSRFLFYVASSKAFIDAVNAETFGSKMPRADWETVGHQPLPLPRMDTQRRIAAFLDEKTAQIDALIARKQALLERLAEKRQAIITQAVTKGLNPAAPMKDTGIDWLGQVPAHWDVLSFRRSIERIEQGWSPQCEERERGEGEWGVLRSGCVNGGRFRPEEHKALPSDVAPRPDLEVHPGDLLMCRASGSMHLIGSAAVVSECPPNLMFSDKTYRIRVQNEIVVPNFAAFSLGAKYMREQIVLSVSGAGGLANNIPQSLVMSYWFARPPYVEQIEILTHLRRTLAPLVETETRLALSIERLSEYRAALITAAVTGQIEGLR